MDAQFHYPPDLLKLLVDTIPKLCKSKEDLLLFFRGAGISARLLEPYRTLLRTNKQAFNKYHVSRELLSRINELGDSGLRARREVVKRVVEFENFSLCWENDRAAARGLVAEIRDVVNVKDSFTKMKIEREEERRVRQEQEAEKSRVARKRTQTLNEIKSDLFALFAEKNAHKRGKALEGVLNRLFAIDGLLVKDAFTVKGTCGNGVIEQIDGLIDLDGQLYLVELKWWNAPLGVGDVAQHLVRVFSRGGQARGLFISYSAFTGPAIEQCRDAIGQGAVIVLALLEELVQLIDRQGNVRDWLRAKTRVAISEKSPYAPM